MNVVGLDLSLTALGYAQTDGLTASVTTVKPAKLRGHERLQLLIERVRIATAGADLVVVEGPAFGAKGSAYHQLAGLWWLIVHDLWRSATPYAVAPPSSLKLYATGKGGAAKDVVLLAAARRFATFDGDNNAADALWLAAMGTDRLGCALIDMPALNRAALGKVTWPGGA